MNRRSFFSAAGGGFAWACAGSIAGGCSMVTGTSDVKLAPGESYALEEGRLVLTLARVSALDKPGGAIKLVVAARPGADPVKVLVVRPDEETLIAFEDRCTHGKRELNYRHQERRLECSSFGHSRFDLRGKVLKGPAGAPLAVFPSAVRDGKLVIEV